MSNRQIAMTYVKLYILCSEKEQLQLFTDMLQTLNLVILSKIDSALVNEKQDMFGDQYAANHIISLLIEGLIS